MYWKNAWLKRPKNKKKGNFESVCRWECFRSTLIWAPPVTAAACGHGLVVVLIWFFYPPSHPALWEILSQQILPIALDYLFSPLVRSRSLTHVCLLGYVLTGASLQLLTTLLTDAKLTNFLFIGAYRDNEVGKLHSLEEQLEIIRQKGKSIISINIGNLSLESTQQYIAKVLDTDPKQVESFNKAVFDKTHGNIFHTRISLLLLQQMSILTYSYHSYKWEWDLNRLKSEVVVSDNVVETNLQRMNCLSRELRIMLNTASYLRSSFDVETLLAKLRKHWCKHTVPVWKSETLSMDFLPPSTTKSIPFSLVSHCNQSLRKVHISLTALNSLETNPLPHLHCLCIICGCAWLVGTIHIHGSIHSKADCASTFGGNKISRDDVKKEFDKAISTSLRAGFIHTNRHWAMSWLVIGSIKWGIHTGQSITSKQITKCMHVGPPNRN